MFADRPDSSIHDQILKTAASKLDRSRYNIYTNPGSEKNYSVGGLYPDIILVRKNDDIVNFIVEVETEDSINDTEAQQWKNFANLSGIFYLLVPRDKREDTESICSRLHINAKFGTYWLANNDFIIKYE